jgi:hypothetical protein
LAQLRHSGMDGRLRQRPRWASTGNWTSQNSQSYQAGNSQTGLGCHLSNLLKSRTLNDLSENLKQRYNFLKPGTYEHNTLGFRHHEILNDVDICYYGVVTPMDKESEFLIVMINSLTNT